MPKKVFLSFRYKDDNWRVQTIKQIGALESEPLLDSNTWEKVKENGEAAVERWINEQMADKSCLIVLIGQNTAGRKWVKYEIKHAWENGKGVIGVHVHNLLDRSQAKSTKGSNPFSTFKVGDKQMADLVKVYDPPYTDSKAVYNYIAENVDSWVATAISDRK